MTKSCKLKLSDIEMSIIEEILNKISIMDISLIQATSIKRVSNHAGSQNI